MTAVPRRMRLARLLDSFRNRDWMGIAIEIAIVAVGVLLAFQIDQGAQNRRQASEEWLFLERLYDEYGRAGDEMRDLAATHEKITGEFREVFAHRRDRAALARFSQIPNFGCPLPRLIDAPFNDTSFGELVASGRINIISDPTLRAEVRNVAAAQAASARQVSAARELVVSLLPAHDRYIQFDMTRSIEPSCEVDWAGMIEDKSAMATIVRAYFLHSAALAGRRRVLDQIEAVRATLACKLEKDDCRQAA
jgi:hypothetical protein